MQRIRIAEYILMPKGATSPEDVLVFEANEWGKAVSLLDLPGPQLGHTGLIDPKKLIEKIEDMDTESLDNDMKRVLNSMEGLARSTTKDLVFNSKIPGFIKNQLTIDGGNPRMRRVARILAIVARLEEINSVEAYKLQDKDPNYVSMLWDYFDTKKSAKGKGHHFPLALKIIKSLYPNADQEEIEARTIEMAEESVRAIYSPRSKLLLIAPYRDKDSLRYLKPTSSMVNDIMKKMNLPKDTQVKVIQEEYYTQPAF